MKIKRNFEMLVATKRRYIIRQSKSVKQMPCAECAEPMLTTEQAAGFFGITQRRIFQIIETEAAHFTEIETGAVMICIKSLATVLKGAARNNQISIPNESANNEFLDDTIVDVGKGLRGSKDYGDDSPLYGAMGFKRKSERASGLTRKKKTPPNG